MVQVLCYLGPSRMATCWLPANIAWRHAHATYHWGKDGPYNAVRFA